MIESLLWNVVNVCIYYLSALSGYFIWPDVNHFLYFESFLPSGKQ